MNYKEMKALAMYMTCSEDGRVTHKDLFYDRFKNIFLSKAALANSRVATAWDKGKTSQGWVSRSCIHVGRYSVDVNPEWIIEDLRNV